MVVSQKTVSGKVGQHLELLPRETRAMGIVRHLKIFATQPLDLLVDKYIATGRATPNDIEKYCQFADDQSAWAIYYATVGVTAQKPAK